MGTLTRYAVLAGIALAFACGAGVVQAAPQVLALVSTRDKVELKCGDGECWAEFSAFCLQKDRFAPPPGTPYRLVGGGEVRLVGTTGDGRQVMVDADRYLSFESLRSHVAMRLSIPRPAMRELGFEKVAVAVGENVSLLPVPVPGDPDPHTAGEIALITASLRPAGTTVVDENTERMIAARLTNRMINALPARAATAVDDFGDLWRQAGGGAADLPAGAVNRAKGGFALCAWGVKSGGLASMRRCLQSKHDALLQFLNSDYWKAVRTGS